MRHFVAVAEELHFGRAAEKLGISQPPLSQSIRRLEDSLQISLLERSSHAVKLTRCGEVFFHEARLALRQIGIVEQATKRAASGEANELRIGFVEASLFRVVPILLAEVKRTNEFRVALMAKSSPDQLTALKNGTLDLAIFVAPTEPVPDVTFATIESSPLVACVSASDPLAKRARIRIAELIGYSLILFSPSRDVVLEACLKAGFTPKISQFSGPVLTALTLVQTGLGIPIVPATARSSGFSGLAYLDIEDLQHVHFDLAIGWRTESAVPTLRNLIDALRSRLSSAPGRHADDGRTSGN